MISKITGIYTETLSADSDTKKVAEQIDHQKNLHIFLDKPLFYAILQVTEF